MLREVAEQNLKQKKSPVAPLARGPSLLGFGLRQRGSNPAHKRAGLRQASGGGRNHCTRISCLLDARPVAASRSCSIRRNQCRSNCRIARCQPEIQCFLESPCDSPIKGRG